MFFCFIGELLAITASNCVRLLRVFGEETEQNEFPLPWSPRPPRRPRQKDSTNKILNNQDLGDISLHHRVRHDDNQYSADIRGYDYLFKYFKDMVTEAEKNNFASILIKAELEEMAAARIILCTCSTAGSPRMTRKFSNRWSNCVSEVCVVVFMGNYSRYRY